MITVKKHISILLTAILLISTLIMAPNTSIKGAEKNQIETKSSLFHEAIVYKEGDDYINVTEFGNNSYVDLNKLKNVYYRLYFDVELFVDATLTFSVYSQDTQKTEKKSYNVQNLNYIYSNSSSYNYLVPIDFSDYSGNIDVSVSFTLANGQKVDSDASVKLHIISSNRIDNGKCGDSLNWTLYEDGELYITGTGEMYDYSIESSDDNFVPWKSYRKNIKTVIADEGVTSIGNYAFQDYDFYQEGTYKDSITTVILPSTLKRIGNSSFQWCNSITKIKIPNSVTTIGKCAFRNCTALFEVVLSNSLSVIPQQAFQNCRQLESIHFPENIRVIGRYAFDSTGLKTITIPNTITELCQNSFSYSSLEGVNVKGDILVDIYAFASCNNLEYAHFSGSITFSGASNDCGYLFKGCPNLQSIAIPSIFRFKETEYPIQSYGNFRDSNALEIKKIRFNDNPKIIDNVIFSNDGKTLLWYNKKLTQQNYTVPDGVEKIAYCAFDSNPYIEHIVLPESLKEFGGRVFADCTNLNNVIIPDGIETLYDFQNCTSLRNIVIPSSVKQMYQSYKNSEETFAGNSDLSVYCESNSYANDFMSEYSFLGVSKDIVYCHFDTNGGNISKTKQAVIPNDKYWTLPLPTKQNADFEGWYTEKNGGTKITEDSVVNSDVSFTLYAHWNYNQVDTEEPTYAPVSDPTESINVTDPPTVPPTDKPTEPATVEPTQPVTEKPSEIMPTQNPSRETKTFFYMPSNEDENAGYNYKLLVQDEKGGINTYEFKPTAMKLDGVTVYSTEISVDITPAMLQYQVYDSDTWVRQITKTADEATGLEGKIIKYDGSAYGGSVPETKPAETTPVVTTPNVTNPPKTSTVNPSAPKIKKANPMTVKVKKKTIKAKKLKKKAIKVNAITVKNAQGKVTYKLVKSGITKKIRKLVKINSKGVITIKKWKKAKKGTYKIKVKVTAAGNSDYNAKTVTKTVKIKVK